MAVAVVFRPLVAPAELRRAARLLADCDVPPVSAGRWFGLYDLTAAATEAAATSMLRQKLPEVRPKRFLWASAFRLGQGQSEGYRRGRWLLVGDAAHAMGPSAGAGMMIGVLGAWRLGVALAATLRTASEEPLAGYEREQRVASQRVQRDNARIFANMALRSAPLAAVRAVPLLGLGHVPAVTGRMARSEALLHLPPVVAPAPAFSRVGQDRVRSPGSAG